MNVYFWIIRECLNECFIPGAIESDNTNNECLKDLKIVIKHHQEVLG